MGRGKEEKGVTKENRTKPAYTSVVRPRGWLQPQDRHVLLWPSLFHKLQDFLAQIQIETKTHPRATPMVLTLSCGLSLLLKLNDIVCESRVSQGAWHIVHAQ